MGKIELFPLRLPEISPGAPLVQLLQEAASEAGGFKPGDILVITSKVVAKAWGLVVDLKEVSPSPRAWTLARKTGRDPRFLELVLDHADDILFLVPLKDLAQRGWLRLEGFSPEPQRVQELLDRYPCAIFVWSHGSIYSSAGIDSSNLPSGQASLPLPDPDGAALQIRLDLEERLGFSVPVIITDTEYTPFGGTLEVARGSSGIRAVNPGFAQRDLYGCPKFGGLDLVVQELAGAAGLLMGQAGQGIPAVLIRGYKYVPEGDGGESPIPPGALGPILRYSFSYTLRILGWRWLLRGIKKLVLKQPSGSKGV